MTFNIWTFLFEAINFVVLAYVLHRLLYRPLQQALDERRQSIQRAQSEAKQAREQATGLEAQLQAQLNHIEQNRQETLRQAIEQARTERKRLLNEAEAAIQRRHDEVRQALERERDETWRALQGEVVRAAVEQTRRLLREAADQTLEDRLALRLADALAALPPEQRAEVRNHWQPGDGAVVESAHELSGEVVRRLTESAQAVVGTGIKLDCRTNPELLGGALLRLGGHVWDSTLAGQLDGKA